MENRHYVYILECGDNTYYTGYTNCITSRIKKHQEGKAAKYTRGRRPVKLMYYEKFNSKSLALKRENYIKRLSRLQKEMFIKEGVEVHIQKSFNYKKDTGILYLVGTPIGNLNDITYRALQTLEEVDLIAAEDTRHTLKLLNHFNINKKMVSYHEHNREKSGENLLKFLEEGKSIALVSDAGMPAISDPGYEIVRDAIKKGITVIPIPGASAAITGLVASGISTKRFFFLGFLSSDKKTLIKELVEVKYYPETLICYEAPHRIIKTLEIIKETIGNRTISLSRELTKKHEEFIRGTAEEIIEYLKETQLKGEITVIIEGAKEADIIKHEDEWWISLSINDHVNHYIEKGNVVKEAIKITALERNLPKREVYQSFHGKL